tara:strand:+ start:1323 stop:1727 length:405 start_codon:yes stop_codon:yes gene_type:complete
MRVNITYSAELDAVPREVYKLIEDVAEELGGACSQTLTSCEEPLRTAPIEQAQQVVDRVQAVRARLADLDLRLSDTLSIFAGYFKAKTEPEPESVESKIGELKEAVADAEASLVAMEEELTHGAETLQEQSDDA